MSAADRAPFADVGIHVDGGRLMTAQVAGSSSTVAIAWKVAWGLASPLVTDGLLRDTSPDRD